MRAAVSLLATRALVLVTMVLAAGTSRAAFSQDVKSTHTGALIVKMKRGVNSDAIAALVRRMSGKVQRSSRSMSVVLVKPPAGTKLGDWASRFEQSGIVEYAEPERMMFACDAPNDPQYPYQWNLQDTGYGIKSQSAWQMSTGEGVIVAIVDTGIRRDGPDLQGTRFVDGYNSASDNTDTQDDNGHGTLIAGIIAQTTNNGYGCAGIAYNASLMPIKVLSASGGGSTYSVAKGIRWAVDHGARVINLSLGGDPSNTMLDAVRYAVQKGAVLCCSTGNGGTGSLLYPAAYPETVAVGALTEQGQRASFSQYGEGLDVLAPGVNILQEAWDPQGGRFFFGAGDGTSFAAPQAVGTVALMLARNPNLTPTQVKEILQRSARDLGPAGWDSETGYGAIDAQAAVNAAGGSTPTPSPEPSDPTYDVAVTQIQAPSSVDASVSVPITVQVQNKGSAMADVSVKLTAGPAGDAVGTGTARVAPGETGSVDFTWKAASTAGDYQITAAASISGQTDANPNDNSRVATIQVNGGGGETPDTSLKFRVYTDQSSYKVGDRPEIRHLVTDSSGQPVSGATIRGTLATASGLKRGYFGSTGSDGTFVFRMRLWNGFGVGTYSVSAQATTANSEPVSTSWSFQVTK